MVEFFRDYEITTIKRPLFYLLSDFTAMVLMGLAGIATFSGLTGISMWKKDLCFLCFFSIFQISAIILAFSMIIGFTASMLAELSSKVTTETPIWEDSLGVGFQTICIFISSIIETGMTPGKSFGDSIKASYQLSSSEFILSAWILLISTCIMSWYFFIKYGKKIPKFSHLVRNPNFTAQKLNS